MSTMNESPAPDERFGAEPPKRGGSKLLLGLGIGCGVLLLLCCGGFAVLGIWGYQIAEDAAITDPARLTAVTGELVSIDIPQTFSPAGGMQIKIPLANEQMTAVVYKTPDDQGFLMLGSFGGAPIDTNQIVAQFEAQMMQLEAMSGEPHNTDPRHEFTVTESESRDFTIRGQPATFNFSKGTVGESATEYYDVIGSFEGNTGTVALWLFVPTSTMSEEEITQMIESIK